MRWSVVLLMLGCSDRPATVTPTDEGQVCDLPPHDPWAPPDPSLQPWAAFPLDFDALDFELPEVEEADCVGLVTVAHPILGSEVGGLEYWTADGHQLAMVVSRAQHYCIATQEQPPGHWYRSPPTDDGAVVHRRFRTPFDELYDERVEHYVNGHMVRRDWDKDGDGTIDEVTRITHRPDGTVSSYLTDTNLDGKPDDGWKITYRDGREQSTTKYQDGKVEHRMASTWSPGGDWERSEVVYADGGRLQVGTRFLRHYGPNGQVDYSSSTTAESGLRSRTWMARHGEIRFARRVLPNGQVRYIKRLGENTILYAAQDPDGSGPRPAELTQSNGVGPAGRTYLWKSGAQGLQYVARWEPGEDRFVRKTAVYFPTGDKVVVEQDWLDAHRLSQRRQYRNGVLEEVRYWTWRCDAS